MFTVSCYGSLLLDGSLPLLHLLFAPNLPYLIKFHMLSHMNSHLLSIPEIANYSLCGGEIQPTACFLQSKNVFLHFKRIVKNIYTQRLYLTKSLKCLLSGLLYKSLPTPVTTCGSQIPFTLRN